MEAGHSLNRKPLNKVRALNDCRATVFYWTHGKGIYYRPV